MKSHSYASTPRHTPGSLRAQQELHIQRRVLEEQRQSAWNKNAAELQRAETNALSYQKLISDRTFKSSVDNYMRQKVDDKKNAEMQIRKAELSILLHEEENRLQEEMVECLKGVNTERMMEMRERVEQLRQARVRQQEQVVAEKLQDAWRRNCPELREVTSKQIDLETAKAWGDQIRIRQQNEEEERRMEQHMVESMKRELELAEEKDREKAQRERSKMQDLAQVWQQQIDSLHRHDDQMRILLQQEDQYLNRLRQLTAMEEARKKLEDSENRKDFGRTLLKQHAAHVRRRNRQVQESLEFDRKLVDSVNKMEEESILQDQKKKEHARTTAALIKETMENRLKIEREREREIDRLDKEEAKMYWERREEEWTAEEEARKHLVNEVIGDLREQLREKMSANRRAQKEVEMEKEELESMMKLSEMEKQKQLDAITKEQTNRRQDLTQQVRELERKEDAEREAALDEHAKRQIQQQSYDDFLAREAAKLGIGRRCQSAVSSACSFK